MLCRLSSGPYFSYYSYFSLLFFLCSYFSLLFSENALLSLLFSPKMFEVTKNCNFFPRSLEVCKNWINIIWAVTMQKFMKYFYFSCNSFFGTFILVFPYHGDIVLLFRENCFLILSFSKSENTQNIPTIPTFHDLNSYFCPTFSKFWALLYPYFFTGGHLKAWLWVLIWFALASIQFKWVPTTYGFIKK